MTTADSTFAIRHSPLPPVVPWAGMETKPRGDGVEAEGFRGRVVMVANIWAWNASSNVVEQWCQSYDVG
ncbi:MAG: hypothetical protein V3W34_14260 [Phycisphaerae bacterium]